VRQLAQGVGLIHELAQLRAAEEFLHLRHDRLRVHEVLRHQVLRTDRVHAVTGRLLQLRQTIANLILQQLAHAAHAAVPKVIDIIHLVVRLRDASQLLDYANHVGFGQRTRRLYTGRTLDLEAAINLVTSHRAQIIALLGRERILEQAARRLNRNRVTGTHALEELRQGFFKRLNLVLRHGRQNNVRVRLVDFHQLDLRNATKRKATKQSRGDLLKAIAEHLARGRIHNVGTQHTAQQMLIAFGHIKVDGNHTLLQQQVRSLLRNLGSLLHQHGAFFLRRSAFALGLQNVFDEDRAFEGIKFFRVVQVRDQRGALLEIVQLHFRGLEEFLGDLFVVLNAKTTQERGGRQLALAIHHDVHDVVDIHLKLNPSATVWNHATAVSGLAVGVNTRTERNARRTVQLRHNHALGAIDNEGTLGRHQGDVAHVRFLLLDVAHFHFARDLVTVAHDQLKLNFQGGGIGHTALHALLDLILRATKGILHELQRAGRVRAHDGENAQERFLKTDALAHVGQDVHLKKLVIAFFLRFQKIWHLHDRRNLGEIQSPVNHLVFSTAARACGHQTVILLSAMRIRAGVFECKLFILKGCGFDTD